ncbi:MAG: hypothetical protein U0326_07630 [Polyangiales bacterium]
MARRNFINAEMIALSAALTDAKRHRPAFLAIPLMAGLLPEVESAHADLLGLSPVESSDEAAQELGELQAREKATDRVHDSKGGGVQVVLQGAIALAETDDEAALYERVKARLFPEEGAIFSASYMAESGNAERIAKELENVETRTTLASIKVRKGVTLLDETRAWVKAGFALGVDESRKVVLEAPRGELERRGRATPRRQRVRPQRLDPRDQRGAHERRAAQGEACRDLRAGAPRDAHGRGEGRRARDAPP